MPSPEELAENENLDGLSEEQLETFRQRAVPQPGGVLREAAVLSNDARRDIPSTIICTGFPSEKVKAYAEEHNPAWLGGLAELRDVTWIDLPTSHWPRRRKTSMPSSAKTRVHPGSRSSLPERSPARPGLRLSRNVSRCSSTTTHSASRRSGKLKIRRRSERCAPSEFVALTGTPSGTTASARRAAASCSSARGRHGRAGRAGPSRHGRQRGEIREPRAHPRGAEDRGGEERRHGHGGVVRLDRGLRERRREQVERRARARRRATRAARRAAGRRAGTGARRGR